MSEETVVDPTQDPFYNPEDTHLDLSSGPKHLADLTSIANEELPPPEPEAVVPPTPDPAFEPEPEIYTFEDGSTAAIEKTAKGWKATLDSKTGAPPEVFYGRTKDEMYQNVMAGKIQATKKIRQQNKQIKLGNQAQPEVQEAPVPRSKVLSADDVAQMKLQLGDNPDLAFETWFQKKSGFSFEELMAMARDGRRARQDSEANDTSLAFMADNPEYPASGNNYAAILGWISKYKLQPPKVLKLENANEVKYAIYDQNLWTVGNIAEAYEDLKADGLIEFPAPPEEVAEEEVAPPPPPRPEVRVRPRGAPAGLGIQPRQTGTTRVPPPEPAAQRLEDLSDAQIEELFNGIRRLPDDQKKAGIERARQRQQV